MSELEIGRDKDGKWLARRKEGGGLTEEDREVARAMIAAQELATSEDVQALFGGDLMRLTAKEPSQHSLDIKSHGKGASAKPALAD